MIRYLCCSQKSFNLVQWTIDFLADLLYLEDSSPSKMAIIMNIFTYQESYIAKKYKKSKEEYFL